VAILGCGAIGLLLTQVARASGASRILAVDRYPFRLDLARQFGAEVLNLEEGDVVERILDLTGSQGADVVFEAAGAEAAMCQTMEIARRGGRVVLIGWPSQRTFPFPLQDIGPRELELHGMFRYCNVYPEALQLIASRQVALAPMITRHFPFADVGATFQYVLDHRDTIMKAVIDLEAP
jgi:L-iditol 2-dehydrogenase